MMNLLRKLRRGPSCSEILEILQSYLDGEVDAVDARKVAAHLADCTECDRESQIYRKIKSSLAGRRMHVDPEILAALRQFGQKVMAERSD